MSYDRLFGFSVDTDAEAQLAALPPSQRALVADILRMTPDYRYDLSPAIFPAPKPGLPSALAAVKTMVATIKSKLIQVDRIGSPAEPRHRGQPTALGTIQHPRHAVSD